MAAQPVSKGASPIRLARAASVLSTGTNPNWMRCPARLGRMEIRPTRTPKSSAESAWLNSWMTMPGSSGSAYNTTAISGSPVSSNITPCKWR